MVLDHRPHRIPCRAADRLRRPRMAHRRPDAQHRLPVRRAGFLVLLLRPLALQRAARPADAGRFSPLSFLWSKQASPSHIRLDLGSPQLFACANSRKSGEAVDQRTGSTNGGAKTAPSERSERHSIQSVDRAVTLLEAIAEAGGESTLTELSHRTQLNISTCHHLLSTLVQPRLCREGAGAALLRARRAHSLSQQCLPAAGRPAGARRAVHRADQRADRRDRASRGAAGRRHDEGRQARVAPSGARRYRHARQDRCAARDRDRQGDARLAARGRHAPRARARD